MLAPAPVMVAAFPKSKMLLPKVMRPLVRASVAATDWVVAAPPNVKPLALFNVKLLKDVFDVPLRVWPTAPLKLTRPVPLVNVPLLLRFPDSFNVPVVNVVVAPLLIVEFPVTDSVVVFSIRLPLFTASAPPTVSLSTIELTV